MSTRSEPRPAPSGGRPWQAAYRRFRELQRQLTDEGARGSAFLLSAAAKGRHVFDRSFRQYLALFAQDPSKLREPSAAFVDELGGIAALQSSYDPDVPGFVFEDVYHLAFYMLPKWPGYRRPIRPASDRVSYPSPLQLYRGQRNACWGVGATLYRELANGPGREAKLRALAVEACQVGHAIANRLGFSYIDAMAVAQHYSKVLGVATWLVDFSRDPWVALFFASQDGNTNDFGIVWAIAPDEWTCHTAGKGNPIGALQLVVPRGVRRIENQKGVFIVAGLPQIFEQYVAAGWETRFRQYTGLQFEDPVLGVTEHTIYPPDDPLLGVLAEVRAPFVACQCGPGVGRPCDVPTEVFTDPLDPKTYEALLTSWLNEFQVKRASAYSEPLEMRDALAVLARFHARLQSRAYATRLRNIVSRSLNRLRDAFKMLYLSQCPGEPVSIRDAINKSYVNQMLGVSDHVSVLQEVLDDIAP